MTNNDLQNRKRKIERHDPHYLTGVLGLPFLFDIATA